MEQHKTSELLAATRRLVSNGEYAKAYTLIETLQSRRSETDSEEQKAIILSYYGLLQARHLKQWEQGRQICEDALSRMVYIPETYINLARIYLDRPIPPYRRKAKSLLRSALKIDGTNRMAHAEMERAEGEKFQALSFLPADNPINLLLAKLLGKN